MLPAKNPKTSRRKLSKQARRALTTSLRRSGLRSEVSHLLKRTMILRQDSNNLSPIWSKQCRLKPPRSLRIGYKSLSKSRHTLWVYKSPQGRAPKTSSSSKTSNSIRPANSSSMLQTRSVLWSKKEILLKLRPFNWKTPSLRCNRQLPKPAARAKRTSWWKLTSYPSKLKASSSASASMRRNRSSNLNRRPSEPVRRLRWGLSRRKFSRVKKSMLDESRKSLRAPGASRRISRKRSDSWKMLMS